MIKLLTRLSLCIALCYSFNSSAYNEAMCILIKQEMQQHSNNKTGRSYRNAARDYNKNCNKPAQTQPKPPPIVKQPEPQYSAPTPVTTEPPTQQNQATTSPEATVSAGANEPLSANEPPANVSNTPVTSPSAAQDDTATLSDTQSPNTPSEARAEPQADNFSNAAQPAAQPATQTTTVQPMQTQLSVTTAPSATANQAPAITAPKSVNDSVEPLLFASVLILVIVLITVAVLMRLRRAKQAKALAAAPVVKAAPKVNPLKPTAADKQALTQPETAPVKGPHADKKATVSAPEVAQADDSASQQPQASSKQPETVENKVASQFTTAAPNSAEFEAAAKNTLERIKNASSFSEPKVRNFDPEAPQTKIKRQQYNQAVAAQKNEPPQAIPREQPGTINTEPELTPSAPTRSILPEQQPNNSHTDNAEHSEISKQIDQEIDSEVMPFKEPEVREFDPNAPLESTKSNSAPQQPEPKEKPEPEEKLEPKQQASDDADKAKHASNPFANLSLDESWDPNSAVKPTIPEKQRSEKSQALIEAEQRAKRLQTKE